MGKQTHKVIIVGSGFGGQCAAINLLKQNIDDFIILERRSFVGGTWTQNSYPGAAVDVASILYSFSFEPYDWSKMFADGDEIKQYTNHIFNKYQLGHKTRVNVTVANMQWHQDSKLWEITSHSGQQYFAQFVINATGPLSTPVIPKFNGAERFKGHSFHTNNWDHSLDLSGKKVAIIGSGASAAQVIPSIVNTVKKLYVFQRSPHWVVPRKDTLFSTWQRRLLKNSLVNHVFRWLTYWALEMRIIGFKYSKAVLELVAGKTSRKHLKAQVPNEHLREQLTPDYTIGCKRVIISSTLYPALSQEHVRLFDKHNGIKQITENTIETIQGDSIEVDVIIYSTGYDATDGIISYPIQGKNNAMLGDFWEEYPRAYLGTTIPNFPNLFIITGPNTGIGHTSAIFVIESQMKYVMGAIKMVDKQACSSIEVTQYAESEYTKMVHKEMQNTVWQTGGCNSWYKGKGGKVIAMFPGFSFMFRRLCKRFKRSDHVFE